MSEDATPYHTRRDLWPINAKPERGLTDDAETGIVSGELNPRWSGQGDGLVMNRKQYQKAADTVVGALLETLESYNHPESEINTVRRVAWSEIDKQFGRFIDE